MSAPSWKQTLKEDMCTIHFHTLPQQHVITLSQWNWRMLYVGQHGKKYNEKFWYTKMPLMFFSCSCNPKSCRYHHIQLLAIKIHVLTVTVYAHVAMVTQVLKSAVVHNESDLVAQVMSCVLRYLYTICCISIHFVFWRHSYIDWYIHLIRLNTDGYRT